MPRNTPGQLGLDLAANLVTNGLNKPDNSAFVYDYSGGFNVVDYLISSTSSPRRIEGLDGVFQKPILGQGAVSAEIATSTLVGANIDLTFTNPTFDLFRNKFVLTDGTAANNLGRVIAHGPGTATIEPTAGTPVFAVATTFAVGSFATSLFEAAGNRGSEGVESLFETPAFVSNQTSITRESVELFRRDMNQTWVTYNGGWWAYAQQPLAIRRYSNALEFKAIWGAQGALGVTTSTLEGQVNYSGGLKEAILDPVRGGIYRPQASLYTEDDFIEFITDVANQNASPKQELTIVCGREALKTVQQFPNVITSVINTGDRTTFAMGSSVRGLDVTTYSIAGINCNFIQAPALNDTLRFPQISTITGRNRMQYTMIVMDLDSYNSVDGRSLPAAEKVYFGPNEVEYGYIQGIGVNDGVPLSDSSVFSGNYPLASSQRDGIRFEIYSDCAYDFMAYNCGWMELTS